MMRRGWILKAAAVLPVLCWAVLMFGCSGGDDEDESLAGEWQVISTDDGGKLPDDYRAVYSFKKSGEYITFEAQNVGSFWIEWTTARQYHVTGSGFYYVDRDYYMEPDTMTFRYKINGNSMTMTRCRRDTYDKNEYCVGLTLKKADLAAVKKSLGTVYAINPEIKGYWVLKEYGDDWFSSEWLSLDDRYFDGGTKYIQAEFSDGYWCTNGGKLILVDDEDYTIQAELDYSIAGSGSGKTLTINGDKWILDDDYLYKSKKK